MRIARTWTCACGHDYDPATWAQLPLFTRLGDDQVSSLVTQWPAHLAVEVRVCARCHRQMARLQRAVRPERAGEEAIAA